MNVESVESRRACLVTGGSRGIGKATATLAATRGYAVGVGYHAGRDEAEDVVRAIRSTGGLATAVGGDVGEPQDVARMFDRLENAFGPVRALVACAGIDYRSRIDELDDTHVARLVKSNIVGTMWCCREAVRRMSILHGGRGGAIVTISSMGATIGGRPLNVAYAASKAFVDCFTMGLGREVAREGIRANTVRPGATLTSMVREAQTDPLVKQAVEATIPMNRMARPEEVAEAILWLLSDAASWTTGAIVDVAGGGFVIGTDTTQTTPAH